MKDLSKIAVFVGIVFLILSVLCIFYATPWQDRVHPKMTAQEIEYIQNHPVFPYRNIGLLFQLPLGICCVIAAVIIEHK